MKLNTAKCKIISYTPKNKTPINEITLNNSTLKIVKYYKYLGIMH